MHYYLANDFTVVKQLDNGEKIEYTFTSHAQARQFVEVNAGVKPPKKHLPVKQGQNRRANSTPIAPRTAEQVKLRAEALKQFKGLV
jgi:hypothetical protein